jgi:trimeric autotransporter adhesin
MRSYIKLPSFCFKLILAVSLILVAFPVSSFSAALAELSDLVTIEQVGINNDAFVRDINATTSDTTQFNTFVLQDGDDNLAYIEQLGEDIFTQVNQFGNGNEVRVNVADGATSPSTLTALSFTLDGNQNSRDIYQNGNFNVATLTQIGDANNAFISQIDDENFASVIQGTELTPCDNCTASITQNGVGNGKPTAFDGSIHSSIFQVGTFNNATISQTFDDNSAKIAQGTELTPCDNCVATIIQSGNGNGAVDPITGDPRTSIFQVGIFNIANITQVGDGNAAEISQGTVFGCDHCTASITQNGDGNGIDNPDFGGIGTRIVQEGSNLNANITQIGNGNLALIDQSNLTAGALTTANIIQNGYDNSASISQAGFNNTGFINQTGNNNYGSITQVGDGLNAQINQNGSGNQALIVQNGSNAPPVVITQSNP